MFPLKEGDIFATDKIRKALDNYKKLYGGYGYIDFVATPEHRSERREKNGQYHDGIRSAQAILCPPHRIFRQHDYARQSDSPRSF